MEDELENITATKPIADEGTLVVFQGTDEDGAIVNFVVEHRYAQDVVNALNAGEEPVCAVPDYMILARTKVPQ